MNAQVLLSLFLSLPLRLQGTLIHTILYLLNHRNSSNLNSTAAEHGA